MIGKRIVLLRIQDFQQRRRGIAAKIAAYFIYLIEHKHRIIRFGATQSLNNASGQSSYISAAMAANFRFVTHAAQ